MGVGDDSRIVQLVGRHSMRQPTVQDKDISFLARDLDKLLPLFDMLEHRVCPFERWVETLAVLVQVFVRI